MTSNNRSNLCKLILKNTTMLWKQLDFSRYPLLFYNYGWTSPYTGSDSDASMGAACSGASLIENTARMCRVITDRYNLGALLTECEKFVIEPGLEEEEVFVTFASAKQAAADIMASPGDFTIAQFKKAIENLQAAYQAAQDFATGIKTFSDSPLRNEEIYDLSGKMVNGKWSNGKFPRGIYIIGGRKVMVK